MTNTKRGIAKNKLAGFFFRWVIPSLGAPASMSGSEKNSVLNEKEIIMPNRMDGGR